MGLIGDLLHGPTPGPILRSAVGPPGAGLAAAGRLAPTVYGGGEPVSLGALIEAAVYERIAGFTVADAMRMPSVIRGVQVICSTLAQMAVVAYRDEAMLPEQPRVLRRPSPFIGRYDFVYQTVYALLAGDGSCQKPGNAWWLITDRDTDELPRSLIQLPGSEVTVDWDDRRFLPVTRWRGQLLPTRDLIHIALGRPAGELLGRSPILEGIGALAVADTAERFAAGWFTSSGVPSAVIKVPGNITEDEAVKLKLQWLESHGIEPTPAVLSGGMELDLPDIDPQRSQMQEARDYGNTVVARLLGIPAPLLHVATSGATITYVGAAGAVEELVKATLAPTYMPPLEFAFSELLPSTQSARFNTRELDRVDVAARFAVYQTAVGIGALTAEDVRGIEGWPRQGPVIGQAFAPQPAAPPAPTLSEVPAGV